MNLPILKQADLLIVTLPESLTDGDWRALKDELLARVGKHRSRGVVIDASVMDVMDSYATRLVDSMARMLKLRGASTVVVGIQPGVAFAMAQLGLKLPAAQTALDLDEGLELLRR